MTPPAIPRELGALREWRTQLARGQRTPLDFDDLTLAACAEAAGAEWSFHPATARAFRELAARHLLGAAVAA